MSRKADPWTFVAAAGTCLMLAGTAWTAPAGAARPAVAAVRLSASGISFAPAVSYELLVLTVTGPGTVAVRKELAAGQGASIAVGEGGQAWPDGAYRYELRVVPRVDPGLREAFQAARAGESAAVPETMAAPVGGEPLVQSGGFRVQGGSILLATSGEEAAAIGPLDQVIPDDLIVQGSACIGLDCVNAESFGFDTVRLKENNLRIKFEDTSATAGFATNDWQLTANDSASGGLDKFSIDDVTGAKTPFTVEAGAATNSLYIDSTGRVGLRTATPVLDLHVNTSNTPALRLEQNSSGGFTAQTWDVAGNEANFFVRDVTGGSRLPFRIRPGAPTGSLDIAATGDVGVGTGSPLAPLHVWRKNSAEAQVRIEDASDAAGTRRLLDMQNNGGIRMRLSDNSTGTVWAYQNINTDFRIDANGGAAEFLLTTAGNVTILGALFQNSDRNVKTGVAAVDPEDVLARLAQVPISTWSYKADRDPVRHMGPMAQDFAAAFGLGADERRLAPADMSGVALAAIQALHGRLERRDAEVAALQAQNADLAARLAALETALRPGIPATAAGQ